MVKRKCSNAGKISVSHFKELQDEFLADIQVETLVNDIPEDLIFNWDQTGLSLVPTGESTMHQAKASVIPITHSDDKRQVTAALAATLGGEVLTPPPPGYLSRQDGEVSSQSGNPIWVGHLAQSQSLVK